MTRAPFSVEWLSQSSHSIGRITRNTEGSLPPTSYHGPPTSYHGPPTSHHGFFAGQETFYVNNPHLFHKTGGPEIRISSPQINEKKQDNQTSSTEDVIPAKSGSEQRCTGGADSGYESEAGRSDCTTPEGEAVEEPQADDSEDCRLGRRLRTAFTTEQICNLEKTFKRHKYLGASERRNLAVKLQLSEVQIKTWFQNRRMKLKRQMQDLRPDPFHPAPFYNVYAYAQQNNPAFQCTHSGQPAYGHIPIMDAVPTNMTYPMDSMNPFNPSAVPLFYLHQQSLMQPVNY